MAANIAPGTLAIFAKPRFVLAASGWLCVDRVKAPVDGIEAMRVFDLRGLDLGQDAQAPAGVSDPLCKKVL
jgi:hypothetical protein